MPESKPHCVFVLPSLGGGGAERVVLNLMRLIDTSTYDRSLIVIDGSGALSNPVAEGVTINDLAMSRLRTAMPKLLAGLRRLRPALVFSTLAHVNLALLASRPLLPRTCLICREASLPSLSLDRMSWPGVMRLACRKLYPQGDLLIASSQRMATELREMGVAGDRVEILPNPVDVTALRERATPPFREPGEGPRYVAMGRLNKAKGFDRLIE